MTDLRVLNNYWLFFRLQFRLGRLKTGTPPRLKKSTIDFSVCIKQEPDVPPTPFSFMNDKVWIRPEDQLACHLTFADDRVGKIVKDNLHLNRHVIEEVNEVKNLILVIKTPAILQVALQFPLASCLLGKSSVLTISPSVVDLI